MSSFFTADFASLERRTVVIIALDLIEGLRMLFPTVDPEAFKRLEARVRLGEDIGWHWCHTGRGGARIHRVASIPSRDSICTKCAVEFMEEFGLITMNEAYVLRRRRSRSR